MKKELTIFIIITLIGLIGFLFTLKKCGQEYETIYDTVEIETTKWNLIPVACVYPKDSLVYSTIYKDSLHTVFDTLKIKEYITEFLTENTFIDTLKNDSNGLIVLTDKIYMNIIKERVYDEKLYTKTKIQKQNSMLYGGLFYYQNKDINSVGVNVGIMHKKNMFTIGLGTNQTYLFNYNRVLIKR